MTTTVLVDPHPGEGLKVEVTICELDPDKFKQVDYLHSGDPVKSYTVHGDFRVMVAEVPDTLPEPVSAEKTGERTFEGSITGKRAAPAIEVYQRPECVYQYCYDPETCKEANKCQCPASGNGGAP